MAPTTMPRGEWRAINAGTIACRYNSVGCATWTQHDKTGPGRVCLSEQACVRRSRVHDDSDVRCGITEARRDLPLDCGESLINACLSVLRVTIGELWKQDVDRIELGDDMTHDQVGAETVGEIDRLPQRFL